jgi:hypothetical protein
MVLLDHGKGMISHVQSGFNCFNPPGHDGGAEWRQTITDHASRPQTGSPIQTSDSGATRGNDEKGMCSLSIRFRADEFG